MSKMTFLLGDCLEQLKTLPDNSVHTCITSPPYFNLRDYATATWEGGDPACDHVESIHKHGGERADRDQTSQVFQFITVCEKCGAVRVDKQIGLEETPEEYVDKLVQVFREVKRVLRDDGTLWLNIGDTYATSTKTCGRNDTERLYGGDDHPLSHHTDKKISHGLKNKDLIGIPWRLAFALQADGFYLRQDIIWCLSGGTWIYARTQKGDMPIMVRDLIRLKQETVKLWNGEKWTQLLGVSKSKRQGTEIEIVLRSGERISCTPTHRFPTNKGVIEASQIIVGDVLTSCILPEPENVKDCVIDEDASWLAGLYIAEGSMSEDTIQIAGHRKESERWDRVQKIAVKYGGSATMTIDGNNMSIRMYGKVLVAILNELVSGRTSKDKCFNPVVWRYSNRVIKSMLDGYLSGDGHKDGDRWRLEFCRNYNLERDLRVACARLGYSLTLNLSTVKYNGKDRPTFRGEIRKSVSNHFNNKNRNEVVKISKARCRYVYDLGVEDEPHLFSLASGVLTHNSKPNPMPESVTDRCTKSHEYIFLLTKSPTYYFDHIAIREDSVDFEKSAKRYESSFGGAKNVYLKESGQVQTKPIGNREFDGKRNKRSVWEITPKPFKEAHFAVYPPDLIEPCVLAGTSEHGCCSKCGAPYQRVVEKKRIRRNELEKDDPRYRPNTYEGAYEDINGKGDAGYSEVTTKGWEPTCDCHADIIPCTILDPFMGAGTTGLVAKKNLRDFVGIELSPEYMEIAKRRINKSVTQLDLFGRGIGV